MEKSKFEAYKINVIESFYKELGNQIQSLNLIIEGTNEINKTLLRSNIKIPNILITYANKLNEISNEFKQANVSMYCSYVEKYDFVENSIIGESIFQDLRQLIDKGIKSLVDYSNFVKEILKAKEEKNLTEPISLEEANLMKKILKQYIDVDNEIFNYDFKSHLINTMTNYLSTNYSGFSIPRVLEEEVIPDWNSLGFQELIPKLQANLINAYREKSLVGTDGTLIFPSDIPDFSPKKVIKTTEEDEKTIDELLSKDTSSKSIGI